MVETKLYIEGLVKELIELAKKKNIFIEQGYIFGSYSKGLQDEYSDIDVALVSEDFEGNRILDSIRLDEIVISLSPKIETHTFRPEEFNTSNLFVNEILKTAIRVY